MLMVAAQGLIEVLDREKFHARRIVWPITGKENISIA
jgi:hypothetical protein